LMTQAALESSHVTQVIPIRVGDRPFEEQHEKYVALAIGGDGDQGRAIGNFIEFNRTLLGVFARHSRGRELKPTLPSHVIRRIKQKAL